MEYRKAENELMNRNELAVMDGGDVALIGATLIPLLSGLFGEYERVCRESAGGGLILILLLVALGRRLSICLYQVHQAQAGHKVQCRPERL